jgi:hypothetical protein
LCDDGRRAALAFDLRPGLRRYGEVVDVLLRDELVREEPDRDEPVRDEVPREDLVPEELARGLLVRDPPLA